MPDLHNSFNAAPSQKETGAEQPNNYFMDFSQFGGEWQEPASRSTNKERGAKVAKSAGFTFSFGESSMSDHPYTVTETMNNLNSAGNTIVSSRAAKPEIINSTTVESHESSSEPQKSNSGEEAMQSKTGPVDISELWPPQVVGIDIPKKSTPEEESVGRHFAYDTESSYGKRWTRESNYIGKHFADRPSPRVERRLQNESSNLGGRHFADESENQYSRYTREEPSAEGRRFREEEPKAKGGRHFAEEANQKERSREAIDSSGEAGKHFRAEQERNNLLRNILNKVKKSKGFRAVVSVALAGVMAFSVAGNFSNGNQASAMGADAFESAVQQTMNHEEHGSSGETEHQHNVLTGYEVLDELIDGSFEQDDNPGCYEADGKVSPDAVANPNQVFELMGIDPANATAEDYGKVFEYIAYSMKYPAAYIAVANNFEGFKGLTTNQAEQKIASMSDTEKQDFQDKLKDTFSRTTYSLKSADGAYRNYGISGKGAGRHSYFVDVNLSNTLLLEAKTVDADGNLTITYSKANCNNPVDFIVRYDSAGNYNVQLVNTTEATSDDTSSSETPDGTDPSETPDGTDPSETPDGTDPSDTPEVPPKTINPKDGANLERIDQDILDQVAEEIRTGKVNVTPNPGVSETELTDAPTSDAYEGTGPTIVQNDTSQNATPVQEDISYDNEYTESQGGANMGEYSPVPDNPEADQDALDSEIPVSDAPVDGEGLDNTLSDLGI